MSIQLEKEIKAAAIRDYWSLYRTEYPYSEEPPEIAAAEIFFCEECKADHCDNNFVVLSIDQLGVHEDSQQYPAEVVVAQYQFGCNEVGELLSMRRLFAHVIRTVDDIEDVSINGDLKDHVDEYRPRRVIR